MYKRQHLDHRQEIVPVNTDGAVSTFHALLSIGSIRIIGCSLKMGGEYVFYILHSDLLLRHHTPWQIIGDRRVICIRSIPDTGIRIQITLHKPGTWSIVDVVRIIMASKCISRIQHTVL